jgi:hypothetical protein
MGSSRKLKMMLGSPLGISRSCVCGCGAPSQYHKHFTKLESGALGTRWSEMLAIARFYANAVLPPSPKAAFTHGAVQQRPYATELFLIFNLLQTKPIECACLTHHTSTCPPYWFLTLLGQTLASGGSP